MKIWLASGSPRRAQILRDAGFLFEVRAPYVDESHHAHELPNDYVQRLAREKVRAAVTAIQAEDPRNSGFVIGADTIVVSGVEILGKPETESRTREMLRGLSGHRHQVHTGVAIVRIPDGAEKFFEEITQVEFAALSEQEIEEYAASGDGNDKAGGYGIQGRAGRFVRRIDGCYFNVMGLPLARVYQTLRDF
jgi:septum formation protein